MLLRIKSISTLSIALLMLIISCSEENLKNELSDDLNIKVQDGRLVFKDLDHYYATKKKLNDKTEPFLDDWEQRIGFQSFRKAFNEFSKTQVLTDKPFENAELTIPAYAYAKVLNPAGEVQIGDKYYKYLRNELIVVSKNDEEKLKTLNSIDYRKDPSIFVSKVIRRILPQSQGRTSNWTDDVSHGCTNAMPGGLFALSHNFVIVVDGSGFRDITLEATAGIWGLVFGIPIYQKYATEIHLQGTSATDFGSVTSNETVYNQFGLYHLILNGQQAPGATFTLYSVGYSGYAIDLDGISTGSCNFYYTE